MTVIARTRAAAQRGHLAGALAGLEGQALHHGNQEESGRKTLECLENRDYELTRRGNDCASENDGGSCLRAVCDLDACVCQAGPGRRDPCSSLCEALAPVPRSASIHIRGRSGRIQ